MSGKQSGMVWDIVITDSKSVSKEGKQVVLLAMADHADHEGENVYPSIGLLAWKTGYSPRQVVRIVQALMRDKLIDLEEKDYGKYHTRRYSLHLDRGTLKTKYSGRNSLKPPPVTSSVIPPCDITVSPPPVTSGCHPNRKSKPSDKPSDSGDSKNESPAPIKSNFTSVGNSYVKGREPSKLPARFYDNDGDEPKPKAVFQAQTELSKYLAANTKWKGFSKLKDRVEWETLERSNREQLKNAIDWAIQKGGLSIKHLDTRIISAFYTMSKTTSKGNGRTQVTEPPPDEGPATLEDVKHNNPALYERIMARQRKETG